MSVPTYERCLLCCSRRIFQGDYCKVCRTHLSAEDLTPSEASSTVTSIGAESPVHHKETDSK